MRVARSVKSGIVLALIVSLVPAVVLLAFVFSAWYRARSDLALVATEERAEFAAAVFEQHINGLSSVGAVAGLAVAPMLAEDLSAANERIAEYRRYMDSVTHAAFVSPEGLGVAGDPADDVVGVDVSDRGYVEDIVGGENVVLRDVIVGRFSGEPQPAVIRAIREDGQLLGMMVMALDEEHLDDVFPPLAPDEILILLDTAGFLAFHSRYPELSAEQRRTLGAQLTRQADPSVEGELVVLDSAIDEGEWLGTWREVPGYGWIVGAFRPAGLVTGPIQREALRGIGWGLLALVVLALIIWYLGNRLSKPARELARAAAQVASGDLDARARVGGEDEFGQVARSFNEMVAKLRQARAESDTRQRQLEFLYEAGLAVTTILPLEELMHTVIREIAKLTDASIVEVFLYEEERRELKVYSQIGLPWDNVTTTFALGEGIPGKVAESRRPIAIPDLRSDPRFLRRAIAESEGLQSLLAVPLITGGEVVGVIDLFTKERREFAESEIELTSTLASIAATGIANARLYEREKKIARTLEAAFVPSSSRIPGMDTAIVYQPKATEAEVGGDFIDVIPLDDGYHGIVVGDVAGKGLQAAVYTNMIKYSLRAYASNRMTPAEVVAAANRVVTSATELERFATLVYCCVDPDGRRIAWVSAGHEEMITYRNASRSIESHSSTATAIGISSSAVFSQESTALELGDMVLLCTDGITEARRGRDFFGIERVREIVLQTCPCTARELADEVFNRACEFAEHRLSDDVAIMVFGPGAVSSGQ